ncbi:MAG TPA: phage holin family protein [Candidatus Krumholzibacteria bacterium]|nr:phage holin family protein [Candidatus Krumholzibacteria bacterium]
MSTFESDEDERAREDSERSDEDEREPRRGIFGSAKHLLHRLVSLLHHRAELFTTELEEEITRLVGVLLCSFAGVQFAIIGLTFGAVTVLLFVPEGARPWVALGLAVLFLGLAAAGGIIIVKIVKAKARPFDATLRELEKDRDRLKDRS